VLIRFPGLEVYWQYGWVAREIFFVDARPFVSRNIIVSLPKKSAFGCNARQVMMRVAHSTWQAVLKGIRFVIFKINSPLCIAL